MTDKKAFALLRKYYLPYHPAGQPTAEEKESAIQSGVLVPDSTITHTEMIHEIKALSGRISVQSAANAFLYSLSEGDLRYRTALSSLIWAKALPEHTQVPIKMHRTGRNATVCRVCGCTHGLTAAEQVDWNEYGVFRYLPPPQYGRTPDFTCAEYVLNDLREFEKLPAVSPGEAGRRILNGIFACAQQLKPHNVDTALVSEIKKTALIDATGNGVHCVLGVLSVCGVLESAKHKGFLHGFTNSGDHYYERDGLNFYPLYFWRGKDGVNYNAANELFGGGFSPAAAVLPANAANKAPKKKAVSKAAGYFTDGVYTVTLTDEERRYLALEPLCPQYEAVTTYSVTYHNKKRTVLFYEGDTVVKVIYEEHFITDDGVCRRKSYLEFDTRLKTENRALLLPLTDRGRKKPVTSANVLAITPFGCSFSFYQEPETCRISVENHRNNQALAVGEEDRIKQIRTDADFHAFMQYYISTCPADYFAQVDAVKYAARQTVKGFGPGDIFRCQVDRRHYAYGLILGKTREIEKWQELPAQHSFRSFMMQPLLIRMYDLVTTCDHMAAEALAETPLRPPQVCADNDIIWGTHKITSHKTLTPEDIQFPLQLARQYRRSAHDTPFTAELLKKGTNFFPGEPAALYVEWGFASFLIPWEYVPEPVRALLDEWTCYDGGVAMCIRAEHCGKSLADILRDTPDHVIRYNLFLPENRTQFNLVMRFLGLPENGTLDDFAAKYGGLTRAEYIALLEARK